MESPFPSASVTIVIKQRDGNDLATRLTGVTSLADLPSAPVEVVAFPAYPVTWLMFYRTSVTSIQDRRMLRECHELTRAVTPKGYTYRNPNNVAGAYLTLFGERLVVRPEDNAR